MGEQNPVSRRSVLQKTGIATGVGITTGLSGCTTIIGGDDEQLQLDEEELDELPEVEATWAHNGPPDASLRSHRIAITVKNYMETMTDGQFTVNIAPGGEVGNTRETIEQVQNNTIQAAQLTGAHLAPFFPDFNVYTSPFLFEDVDLALAVMDGPFGDTLKEAFLDDTGMRIIGSIDVGGFQTISSNTGPLDNLEVLEGQSIRTMSMDSHLEFYSQLGMNPEPMDIGELYQALDTGVMDAQANPIETMLLFSLHEVQDYKLLNGPVMALLWLPCNNGWFEDLPATYQNLWLNAGREASIAGRRMTRYYRENGQDYINSIGIDTYDPDEAFINEVREQTKEPVDNLIRDVMDRPELFDELENTVEETKEELGYGSLG